MLCENRVSTFFICFLFFPRTYSGLFATYADALIEALCQLWAMHRTGSLKLAKKMSSTRKIRNHLESLFSGKTESEIAILFRQKTTGLFRRIIYVNNVTERGNFSSDMTKRKMYVALVSNQWEGGFRICLRAFRKCRWCESQTKYFDFLAWPQVISEHVCHIDDPIPITSLDQALLPEIDDIDETARQPVSGKRTRAPKTTAPKHVPILHPDDDSWERPRILRVCFDFETVTDPETQIQRVIGMSMCVNVDRFAAVAIDLLNKHLGTDYVPTRVDKLEDLSNGNVSVGDGFVTFWWDIFSRDVLLFLAPLGYPTDQSVEAMVVDITVLLARHYDVESVTMFAHYGCRFDFLMVKSALAEGVATSRWIDNLTFTSGRHHGFSFNIPTVWDGGKIYVKVRDTARMNPGSLANCCRAAGLKVAKADSVDWVAFNAIWKVCVDTGNGPKWDSLEIAQVSTPMKQSYRESIRAREGFLSHFVFYMAQDALCLFGLVGAIRVSLMSMCKRVLGVDVYIDCWEAAVSAPSFANTMYAAYFNMQTGKRLNVFTDKTSLDLGNGSRFGGFVHARGFGLSQYVIVFDANSLYPNSFFNNGILRRVKMRLASRQALIDKALSIPFESENFPVFVMRCRVKLREDLTWKPKYVKCEDGTPFFPVVPVPTKREKQSDTLRWRQGNNQESMILHSVSMVHYRMMGFEVRADESDDSNDVVLSQNGTCIRKFMDQLVVIRTEFKLAAQRATDPDEKAALEHKSASAKQMANSQYGATQTGKEARGRTTYVDDKFREGNMLTGRGFGGGMTETCLDEPVRGNPIDAAGVTAVARLKMHLMVHDVLKQVDEKFDEKFGAYPQDISHQLAYCTTYELAKCIIYGDTDSFCFSSPYLGKDHIYTILKNSPIFEGNDHLEDQYRIFPKKLELAEQRRLFLAINKRVCESKNHTADSIPLGQDKDPTTGIVSYTPQYKSELPECPDHPGEFCPGDAMIVMGPKVYCIFGHSAKKLPKLSCKGIGSLKKFKHEREGCQCCPAMGVCYPCLPESFPSLPYCPHGNSFEFCNPCCLAMIHDSAPIPPKHPDLNVMTPCDFVRFVMGVEDDVFRTSNWTPNHTVRNCRDTLEKQNEPKTVDAPMFAMLSATLNREIKFNSQIHNRGSKGKHSCVVLSHRPLSFVCIDRNGNRHRGEGNCADASSEYFLAQGSRR